MKLLFIVLFAAVATQATKLKWSQNDTTDEDLNIDQEWTDFKKTHGRTFHKLAHEEERKAIFENNLKMIKTHNAKFAKGLSSYQMAVNQFTDMTSEEFRSIMLPRKKMVNRSPQKGVTFLPPMNIGELPEEVDWRKEGYVTPVKKQGDFCGSCWAFSAVGSIEGQNFRKTGKLVSLSEQNLVDCSTSNDGCDGGYPFKAFNDLAKSSGIDTEDSYPYVGERKEEDRTCRFNNNTVGAKISGYKQIKRSSEEELQNALATVGPIAILVNAELESFHYYSKGVYYDPPCRAYPLDHAMLLVGYGTEDGMDYWLVKNSWGVTWGENGYIKMARNKNNHCGIASDANYPLL